jgi:BMFP domain-containing protein YqiC
MIQWAQKVGTNFIKSMQTKIGKSIQNQIKSMERDVEKRQKK